VLVRDIIQARHAAGITHLKGGRMRVVVTGGAGFIGGNVCRELAAADGVTDVVAFDDLSTGAAANLDGVDATLVEATILDPAALTRAFAGASAVVHLAARPSVPKSLLDPFASHDVNATGTVRVLEAARAVGAHVIVASSSSVYGATKELPKHELLPTRPMSPYAASKLATEAYALAYGESFGLPVLAFRFFNVYGPLQAAGHSYAAVVPAFVDAALAGRPVTIYGDGRQTRDFTYVGTVARVITDAVQRRVTSDQPVNLAFGTRIDLLELVRHIGTAIGGPVGATHEPARVGDIRDSQAAQESLLALFADVVPVPLEEGLANTVAWFRESAALTP
jgi:UDP-glucose 4-epimerase